ncbi:hypothetical protein JCM24511_05383 [Saitozyma sp. JCM 24511]|nr:hypothetical protein JCM24511_05383 [Saitozyma sp. JCM 24511]
MSVDTFQTHDAAAACAPPPAGVYTPLPSFFKNEWNGDPDYDAMERYCERLLASGVTGVILNSPTAESMSLCPGERLGFLTTISDFLAKRSQTALASPAPSTGFTTARPGRASVKCIDASSPGLVFVTRFGF